MNRWQFAFGRRWISYLVLALVFAAACIGLSRWQVSRLDEARTANRLIDSNFHATPVSLESALPSLNSYSAEQQWKQVTASGRYLVENSILVRNRPMNGQPGFEMLSPLQLDDGRVFVVDRGYLPTGSAQDRPDSIPAPPSGPVTVTARLQAGEPRLAGRNDTARELATINLPDVQQRIGKATFTGAYGLLVSETPAASIRPVASKEPQLDEGLHISYAIQWVIFAIMGLFGLWYAMRQEYRMRNADDPQEQLRTERKARKQKAKTPTDSDIEDSILETTTRR